MSQAGQRVGRGVDGEARRRCAGRFQRKANADSRLCTRTSAADDRVASSDWQPRDLADLPVEAFAVDNAPICQHRSAVVQLRGRATECGRAGRR